MCLKVPISRTHRTIIFPKRDKMNALSSVSIIRNFQGKTLPLGFPHKILGIPREFEIHAIFSAAKYSRIVSNVCIEVFDAG